MYENNTIRGKRQLTKMHGRVKINVFTPPLTSFHFPVKKIKSCLEILAMPRLPYIDTVLKKSLSIGWNFRIRTIFYYRLER